MKISRLRLRRLQGVAATDAVHWEERSVRALDLYPEYRDDSWRPVAGEAATYFERGVQIAKDRLLIRSIFLEVETDDGATGVAGPLAPSAVSPLKWQIAPTVVGRDPMATELIWDLVYRTLSHGRQGDGMLALSALDLALWDLRGKVLGVPAHRLAGGATRETVPLYASMYGFAVSDLGLVRERALWAKSQGYTAQKWFLRYGPADGNVGLRRNVELVRTVREAVGDDDDIMVDAWSGLDVGYAVALARQLEELRPLWFEEPVLAGRTEGYRAVRERGSVPVAGGENEYTRWGIRHLVEKKAVDYLQPDAYWTGGLTELGKIAAFAGVYEVPVIPHGTSLQASQAFSFSQPPSVAPLQEHLMKFTLITQHFLANPIDPEGGALVEPATPGLGMTLDEDVIEEEVEL